MPALPWGLARFYPLEAPKAIRLSLRATSRTPSKPLVALVRLCVRSAVVCSVFSLVGRLPSAPSVDGSPPVFGHFVW